jgi:hypothetical protein
MRSVVHGIASGSRITSMKRLDRGDVPRRDTDSRRKGVRFHPSLTDLTDGQWALLEPLLPKGRRSGRPPKWTKRQLIDGIR